MNTGSGVLAVILARGGSKGLPGKNIRLVAGLPLIAHTLLLAKRSRAIERCLVSTDSEEIAAVARTYGGGVPFLRPAELAQDDSFAMTSILHAVRWLEQHEGYHPEYVMLLQPTSPLRELEDIERPIQMARERGADAVISVCPATQHPYWTKRIGDDGRLTHFLPLCEGTPLRQQLPPAYAPNGAVYLAKRQVLLEQGTWYTDRTYAYVMPPERSLDIDTEEDLQVAELLLTHRRLPVIHVAGRAIGHGHPCFIIAEAGVNHNGDLALACRLVDVAKAAGADAVKFQTFQADALATTQAPKAAYQRQTTAPDESQRAMLRRLALSPEAHRELATYSHQQGILFLSTPFDEASADLLDALGVPAFKIPSGELTNHAFLRHVARKGRPVILSTGMATWAEVDEAVRAVHETGNRDVILLQCVSSYPAQPAEVNLQAMRNMAAVFRVPVGFSDHTRGIDIALGAVALGACVIEKHITLDRSLPGPDHRMSLEPGELAALAQGIRHVEASRGHGRKEPAPSEADTAAVARKSLVAARDVPAGTRLTEELIAIKRPGTGLPPAMAERVLGRVAAQDIPAETLLTWEMLK